tara:strand:+ start:231 stop:1019 length:789 start_codon:yes stop_codon:yes gene_type:complete
MDGQNYVVFHSSSADDSYMNSSANFRGADVGATFIDLFFASSAGVSGLGNSGGTGYDKVRLTVTATHEENALEAVAAALAGSRAPVTVVADDRSDKQVFVHDHITAVAITLAAQQNFRPVEAITNASAVTRTLTTSESGKLFTVDMSTVDNNVAITLPTATDAGVAGTYYDFCFLVDSDDDADFSITTGTDAIDIFGYLVTGGANSTLDDVDGLSKFTLDASVAQTVEGCRIHLLCDGANWHLSGYLKTAVGTVHLVESASA